MLTPSEAAALDRWLTTFPEDDEESDLFDDADTTYDRAKDDGILYPE